MGRTNAPAERRSPPIIQQYLTRHKDQIAAALPKHVDADRMARIALTECRKTPALMKANPQSLFGAIIQCSQLGLEPGSALGHAYLIPFKDEVQLIIGYRGMIDLARRSGQVLSLTARVVREQDEFSYEFGLNEDLRHVPAEGESGRITHVYAVAKLSEGGLQWDVMSAESINSIRDGSQGYQNAKRKNRTDNPWMTNYEEMAKKTVIRRLFKYLPVSVEMQRAGGLDEMADANISQRNDSIIEGEWEAGPLADESDDEPQTRTDRVKSKLRSQQPQADGQSTDDAPAGPDFDTLAALIKESETTDEIDDALADAGALSDDDVTALEKRADERRAQINNNAEA